MNYTNYNKTVLFVPQTRNSNFKFASDDKD